MVVNKIKVNAPKMIVAIKLFNNVSLLAKIVSNPKTRVLQAPIIVKVLSIVNSKLYVPYQNFLKNQKWVNKNKTPRFVEGFLERQPVFREE